MLAFVFAGGWVGRVGLAVARPFSAFVWSASVIVIQSSVAGVSIMWSIQFVPWGARLADEITQDSVMYPHDQ